MRHSSQVPTSEWHCNICRDRLALRESKHSALTQFEGSSSIEKHRNKAEEEVLLNTIIDKRISAVSTTGRVKESAKDKDRGESANGSNASLAAMEPAPGEVSACCAHDIFIVAAFIILSLWSTFALLWLKSSVVGFSTGSDCPEDLLHCNIPMERRLARTVLTVLCNVAL